MDNQGIHEPLTPSNCSVILINYQTKLASAVNSVEEAPLLTNAVSLARTAKAFDLPTILTTIGPETFGGPVIPQLRAIFPALKPFDCTRKSIWEDSRVVRCSRRMRAERSLSWQVCGQIFQLSCRRFKRLIQGTRPTP